MKRVQARHSFSPGRAKQVENQVQPGLAAGDVVLQVAVNALVAQVEGRGQADQQHLALELVQAEALCQPVQPQGLSAAFGFLAQFFNRVLGPAQAGLEQLLFNLRELYAAAPIRTERPVQQGLGGFIGHIQAAKIIAGVLTGQPPAADFGPQAHIQAGQFGLEMAPVQVRLIG